MEQNINILRKQRTELSWSLMYLSDKINRLNEDKARLDQEISRYENEAKRIQVEYEKVCLGLDTIENDLLIKKVI